MKFAVLVGVSLIVCMTSAHSDDNDNDNDNDNESPNQMIRPISFTLQEQQQQNASNRPITPRSFTLQQNISFTHQQQNVSNRPITPRSFCLQQNVSNPPTISLPSNDNNTNGPLESPSPSPNPIPIVSSTRRSYANHNVTTNINPHVFRPLIPGSLPSNDNRQRYIHDDDIQIIPKPYIINIYLGISNRIMIMIMNQMMIVIMNQMMEQLILY